MSRSVRIVGAALIPAFALPLGTATVARAAVPDPPTNSKLPSGLDIASPYVAQSICDPAAKPGVTAFARLMANHYEEFNYGISRECNHGLTEHSEGRALDWMLDAYDPHEREVADSVISWLLAPDSQGRPAAMARRFGVMYIIWNKQIWGTYDMDAGWRPYHGASPHTDHIHFSFSWDGAMQRTSWWTGKPWTEVSRGPSGPTVPITPPTSYPTLREGASGPDVVRAQKVIGVDADGVFGPGTKRALLSWQRDNGVSVTGVLDAATWDRMVELGEIPDRGDSDEPAAQDSIRRGSTGASVKTLQRLLDLPADGTFGPATDKAVRAYQEKKGLRVDGFVTDNVWKALNGEKYVKNGDSSTPEAPRTSLRRGSTGESVKALQRLLKVTADGKFGSGTEKALKDFQKRKSLRVDGIVTDNVWKALNGESYDKNGTVPPTPKPEAPQISLRRGSTGESVKALQRLLKVTVDGKFGSGTEKALKDFQERKGLRVDGIVTTNVWKALDGKTYVRNGATAKPEPKPEAPQTSIRRGSTGAAVKTLQRILGVSVDGSFGSGTEKALKDFQKRKGLRVDGIVTTNVWNALNGKTYTKNAASSAAPAPQPKQSEEPTDSEDSGDDSDETEEPAKPSPATSTVKTSTEFTPLKSKVLAEGSRNEGVKSVQRAVGGVAVDGSYGGTTTKAVRGFQRASGLKPTGVVDESTWDALEEKKYPFLKYRTTVLKPGSTGPAVEALQTYLGLPVTGEFDDATATSVKFVQKQHGLTRTGYVGGVTWEALESEVRARR